MANTADVVIIGGGIAGLALAVELKRRKVERVVLLERNYIGSGASGRNVGRIRSMQLTEFLTHYAILCQRKYDQMAEALGFNVLFWRVGYLWLLYEPDEIKRMRPVIELHQRFGVGSELVDPETIYRSIPYLRAGEPLAGGVWNKQDGIIHHDAAVWAHFETARKLGVEIRQNTQVLGVDVRAGQIDGVQLSGESISTRNVVNAAGAWSSQVSAMAGVKIPNLPFRREVLVSAPVKPFLREAITFYRPTEGWFNQTLRGEVVAGVVDPQEPPGTNAASSFDFLSRTASLLIRKMPALADLTVIRQWAGMYDVTPDHMPLVGESNLIKGWYQANGWSGRGMLLGPFSMELLAEELVTGSKPLMLQTFDPNRFTGHQNEKTVEQDYYQRY